MLCRVTHCSEGHEKVPHSTLLRQAVYGLLGIVYLQGQPP